MCVGKPTGIVHDWVVHFFTHFLGGFDRRPPQRKFQTSSPGWLVDSEAGKFFFLHYRGGFLSAYEEENKAEPPLFTHT